MNWDLIEFAHRWEKKKASYGSTGTVHIIILQMEIAIINFFFCGRQHSFNHFNITLGRAVQEPPFYYKWTYPKSCSPSPTPCHWAVMLSTVPVSIRQLYLPPFLIRSPMNRWPPVENRTMVLYRLTRFVSYTCQLPVSLKFYNEIYYLNIVVSNFLSLLYD